MNNIISLQAAIECVEALSLEDQQLLIELIHKRLIEKRRAEIAKNAAETLKALETGRANCGTVADLMDDLLTEA